MLLSRAEAARQASAFVCGEAHRARLASLRTRAEASIVLREVATSRAREGRSVGAVIAHRLLGTAASVRMCLDLLQRYELPDAEAMVLIEDGATRMDSLIVQLRTLTMGLPPAVADLLGAAPVGADGADGVGPVSPGPVAPHAGQPRHSAPSVRGRRGG